MSHATAQKSPQSPFEKGGSKGDFGDFDAVLTGHWGLWEALGSSKIALSFQEPPCKKNPFFMNTLQKIQREGLKKIPDFQAGDTVRVHAKIKEGDKERIQVFEGVVLRRKGHGIESSFTVRKVSYGVGVERIFPIHSPMIDKIEIASRGHVRRARLYYLRDLSGKKARIEGELYKQAEEAAAS